VPTILTYRTVILVLVTVLVLISLIIEWPFARLLFPGRKHPWRRSLLGVALSNVVSYTLLLPGASRQSVKARCEKS